LEAGAGRRFAQWRFSRGRERHQHRHRALIVLVGRAELAHHTAHRPPLPEQQDQAFIELDSRNHILLAHEPAWMRFCEAVLDFMDVAGARAGREDPAFASLSAREREILALIAEGLGNAEIAGRLSISDKTVRNHVSNIFDKLGVWTRAQAIVFVHDHGFAGVGRPTLAGPSKKVP
jgi:ATP/maltotriose-dependent transcriptional regulator MalT